MRNLADRDRDEDGDKDRNDQRDEDRDKGRDDERDDVRDGDRVDHGENNIGASLIELPQSDQQNPKKKIFESTTSLCLTSIRDVTRICLKCELLLRRKNEWAKGHVSRELYLSEKMLKIQI